MAVDEIPDAKPMAPWLARLREWLAAATANGSMQWLAASAALVAAIVGVGWQASWAPRWDALLASGAEHHALKQESTRLQARVAGAPAWQRRRETLAAEAGRLEQALLHAGQTDALLAALHRTALRHGLRLAALRTHAATSPPQPAAARDAPLARLPLVLRAHGRYAQVVAWLADLAEQRGAVTLQRFSLRAAGKGEALILDAVAVAHMEAGPVPTTTGDGAARRDTDRVVAGDPFTPDRLQTLATGSDALAMVGVLRDRRRRYGIVNDNGRIRHVRVGDVLGRHDGRVVRIDDDAMAWRERGDEGAGQWIDRTLRLDAGRGG